MEQIEHFTDEQLQSKLGEDGHRALMGIVVEQIKVCPGFLNDEPEFYGILQLPLSDGESKKFAVMEVGCDKPRGTFWLCSFAITDRDGSDYALDLISKHKKERK